MVRAPLVPLLLSNRRGSSCDPHMGLKAWAISNRGEDSSCEHPFTPMGGQPEQELKCEITAAMKLSRILILLLVDSLL